MNASANNRKSQLLLRHIDFYNTVFQVILIISLNTNVLYSHADMTPVQVYGFIHHVVRVF